MFLKDSAVKLLEHLNINKYTINLEKSKQLFYKLIYSFRLIELKTVKTHIENNLSNNCIGLYKSSIEAFILFIKK